MTNKKIERNEEFLKKAVARLNKQQATLEKHLARLEKLTAKLQSATDKSEAKDIIWDIDLLEDTIESKKRQIKDTGLTIANYKETIDILKAQEEDIKSFKFDKIDTWLEKEKQGRLQFLDRIRKATEKLEKGINEAQQDSNNYTEEEFKEVGYTYREVIRKKKVLHVTIDKKEYRFYSGSTAENEYYRDQGCGLAQGRDFTLAKMSESQREKEINEEMRVKKLSIINSVKGICGTEITEVKDLGDVFYVKGSNNKIARITAKFCGGYNIQCLHVRVYIREVSKEDRKYLSI